MTSLDHQREIRWQGTNHNTQSAPFSTLHLYQRPDSPSIPRPRRLIIRIRRGHIIRQLSRPLKHLPLVVRSILVLDLFRHRLDLVDGVGDADEVSPGDSVERVASGADFAVDLVASADATQSRLRDRSAQALHPLVSLSASDTISPTSPSPPSHLETEPQRLTHEE